ncbi:3647_t:CDS:10 [Paraglomus occultum]|uniref:3647_t:CDS:1 n=1 Tax=Paraglomus occultum TaxID=144539 RepID=A0A9N9FRK5_9GLOM|nr:3647_t:CDS:10 [Paraglomus occultum]
MSTQDTVDRPPNANSSAVEIKHIESSPFDYEELAKDKKQLWLIRIPSGTISSSTLDQLSISLPGISKTGNRLATIVDESNQEYSLLDLAKVDSDANVDGNSEQENREPSDPALFGSEEMSSFKLLVPKKDNNGELVADYIKSAEIARDAHQNTIRQPEKLSYQFKPYGHNTGESEQEKWVDTPYKQAVIARVKEMSRANDEKWKLRDQELSKFKDKDEERIKRREQRAKWATAKNASGRYAFHATAGNEIAGPYLTQVRKDTAGKLQSRKAQWNEMDDMGIFDANEDFDKFLAPGEKFEDYDTNVNSISMIQKEKADDLDVGLVDNIKEKKEGDQSEKVRDKKRKKIDHNDGSVENAKKKIKTVDKGKGEKKHKDKDREKGEKKKHKDKAIEKVYEKDKKKSESEKPKDKKIGKDNAITKEKGESSKKTFKSIANDKEKGQTEKHKNQETEKEKEKGRTKGEKSANKMVEKGKEKEKGEHKVKEKGKGKVEKSEKHASKVVDKGKEKEKGGHKGKDKGEREKHIDGGNEKGKKKGEEKAKDKHKVTVKVEDDQTKSGEKKKRKAKVGDEMGRSGGS